MKKKNLKSKSKVTSQVSEPAPAAPVAHEAPAVKVRRFSWKVISISIGAVVIVIALGGFAFIQYTAKDKQQMSGAEVKSLVASVGKIIALPQNEVPNVATVVDVAKLKGQPFFIHAENGDKVLIYAKTGKAYLYRPGSNKIIEVGPITQSQLPQVAGAQSTGSASARLTPSVAPQTVTVAIYNGTNIPKLAAGIRKRLVDSIPGIAVVATGNAGQYYQETMVIDLHNNPEVAQAIAGKINGVITDLPSTEASPAADILVIAGFNDKE